MLIHPNPQRTPIWRVVGVLSLLCFLAYTSGACKRVPLVQKVADDFGNLFQGSDKENVESFFEVQLDIPYPKVRPGDPLYVVVAVKNVSDDAILAQVPDASTVEFLALEPGAPGPVKAPPVFSRNEAMGETRNIAAGETWRRTFVFTLLTKTEGSHRFQATYYPVPRGIESDLIPVIAKAVSYQVAGRRSLRRDRDGIVLKEDAIAIAKRELGRPTVDATAFLVYNDGAGFYDWWITLTIDPKDLKPDEQPLRAYFVNPYRGTIVRSRQARPYVSSDKKSEAKPTPRDVPLPPPDNSR